MSHDKNSKLSSRRGFLASGALLGVGVALTGSEAIAAPERRESAIMNNDRPDADYNLSKPSNIIYSACLQCNTGCGISAKLQDGVVVKIDGNAYNPWTLLPQIPFKTPLETGAAFLFP